jgi:hypothetical protein
MIYKVKFNINGGLKGMPYLQKGDVVEVVNCKGQKFKVQDVWAYEGQPVYDMGFFGLVRSDELERID